MLWQQVHWLGVVSASGSLTDAGWRLVDDSGPAFAQIANSVSAVHELAAAPRAVQLLVEHLRLALAGGFGP